MKKIIKIIKMIFKAVKETTRIIIILASILVATYLVMLIPCLFIPAF